MFLKVLTILAVVVCAQSRVATSDQKVLIRSSRIGSSSSSSSSEEDKSAPKYEFSYNVNDPHTKDKKGQKEEKVGDVVKGEYWLIEPDGRKRTVKYQSDKKSGFNAKVEYSRPLKHIKDSRSSSSSSSESDERRGRSKKSRRDDD